MIEGVDYSDGRPSPAGLVSVGKQFVGRYVGAGYGPKLLLPVEASELSSAGLKIVSLVEGAELDPLDGFDTGVNHANLARAWHLEHGYPWPVPCYFAVDFDVQAFQWGAVREYFHGAASSIGLSNVGIYGGLNAMRWAHADDVARWFYQTYAWSAGIWFPGNHLEQYRNDVYLVGGTVDLDRSPTGIYGGWTMTAPDTTPSPIDSDLYAIEAAYAAGADTANRRGSSLNLDLRPGYTRRANDVVQAFAQAILNGELVLHVESMTDLTPITDKLESLSVQIDAIEPAATVDAVAIARALVADAGFVSTLGAAIASQLAQIQGTIILSGTLSGGIKPPPQ